MVNSGSFDSDVDRNEKDGFTQTNHIAESPQSVISMHGVNGSLCENDFTTQTADSLPVSQAIEPTATKTEYKCNMSEVFIRSGDIISQCNSRKAVEYFQLKNNLHETRIASGKSATEIELIVNSEDSDDKCILKANTKPFDDHHKPSVCCSVPLERVQDVLKVCGNVINKKIITANIQNKRIEKDMCLYCDRTFTCITANLKQKLIQRHIDRSHSTKHNRRLSVRRQSVKLSATACMFCDKLNDKESSLKQLFEHLALEHPRKYFGCLDCEIRFPNLKILEKHKTQVHNILVNSSEVVFHKRNDQLTQTSRRSDNLDNSFPIQTSESLNILTRETKNEKPRTNVKKDNQKSKLIVDLTNRGDSRRAVRVKIKKNKSKYINAKANCDQRETKENSSVSEPSKVKSSNVEDKAYLKRATKTKWVKELKAKKVSVVSSKVGIKPAFRNTRQRTKVLENIKNSKRKTTKIERNVGPNVTAKYFPYQTNGYPFFDVFRIKKITDHSIDNLRISSMTFDDVFDKAFFNRVKCNIQENLLNFVDGKLFKSVESENRISSFQKLKDVQPEEQAENVGVKISTNAVAPVAALLTDSQFGEDLESHIEYGSKPSKKKANAVVNDEVHYKYFTRRKYQAVISENKDNRDLSKLDIWTQIAVKTRQQKILSDKKTEKEILEYKKSDEYKAKVQLEELNGILDKRGPLEDLKQEAIRTVALEKLNGNSSETDIHNYFDVTIILNDLLNSLFSTEPLYDAGVVKKTAVVSAINIDCCSGSSARNEEIPTVLELRRLSCRSTEGAGLSEFDQTKLTELTGEWARSRIYVCAACGLKVPNAKVLIDHKNFYHEQVWCQHYEFVGNQGELYRHLSIPGLGKIGAIEEGRDNSLWHRSGARECSKCSKRFNSLGDLHRHILECGGDWSWVLARKKYKYRHYGSKTRKKKRGLLKFLHTFRYRKVDQSKEKRKKKFNGPRQKPSDADSIERMLANLPPKRITRKVICLKDGFQRSMKNQKIVKTNKNKTMKKNKLQIKETVKNKLRADMGGNSNGSTSLTKSRRLLRSNSVTMFEGKASKTSPKIKKENSNTNNVVKRHSVRNINKNYSKNVRSEKIRTNEHETNNLKNLKVNVVDIKKTKKSVTAAKLKIRTEINDAVKKNSDPTPILSDCPCNSSDYDKSEISTDIDKNDTSSGCESNSNLETNTNSVDGPPCLEPMIQNEERSEKMKMAPKKKFTTKPPELIKFNRDDQKQISEKIEDDVDNEIVILQNLDAEQKEIESVAVERPVANLKIRKTKTKKKINASKVTTLKINKISKIIQVDGSSPTSDLITVSAFDQEESVVCVASDETTTRNGNAPEEKSESESNSDLVDSSTSVENDNCSKILTEDDGNLDKNLENVCNANDNLPVNVLKEEKTEMPANKLNFEESKETALSTNKLPLINYSLPKRSSKKSRGLNDCIAMLTNKLQDKNISQAKNNEPPACCNILQSMPLDNSVQSITNADTTTDCLNTNITQVFSNNTCTSVSDFVDVDESHKPDEIIIINDEPEILNCSAASVHVYNNCYFPAESSAVSSTLCDTRLETEVNDKDALSSELVDHTNVPNNFFQSFTNINGKDVAFNLIETAVDGRVPETNINKEPTPTQNLDAVPIGLKDISAPKNYGCDLDISTVLTKKCSTFKKLCFRKPEKNRKKKKKLKRQKRMDVKKSKAQEIAGFVDASPQLFNESSTNVNESNKKWMLQNDIFKKSMQYLSNSNSEILINTSDELSNSGKENMINRTDNILKYKKTKKSKPFENYVYAPKQPKANNQILSVANAEFVDSDDDIPLAEFIKTKVKNADLGNEQLADIQADNKLNAEMTVVREENDVKLDDTQEISIQHVDGKKKKKIKKVANGCTSNGRISLSKDPKVTCSKIKRCKKYKKLEKSPSLVNTIDGHNQKENITEIDNVTRSSNLYEQPLNKAIDTNIITENVEFPTRNDTLTIPPQENEESAKTLDEANPAAEHKIDFNINDEMTENVHNKNEADHVIRDKGTATTFDRKERRRACTKAQLKSIVDADPILECKSSNSKNSNEKKGAKAKGKQDGNSYCDICNKTFTRSESLLKHKRTLTHIAKLSEIEALEANKKVKEDDALRQQQQQQQNVSNTETFNETFGSNDEYNVNISTILHNTDPSVCDEYLHNSSMTTPFALASAQDSLKLVDIINDVLSKPVENDFAEHDSFSNLILQPESEVKRCKSLGERKSFDCDKLQLNISSPARDFVDAKISSAADVIVEKQISLLENMIEDNQTNFHVVTPDNYSSHSNSSEFSLLSSSKQEELNDIRFTHNTNIITNLIKPTLEEDHLIRQTQYEEISEDSNSSHFQFEEQKSRKALNRDEELFLECCSLLKSSSDVSDLSKKPTKSDTFLNNFGLKPLDEADFLEQKALPQTHMNFTNTQNTLLNDSEFNSSVTNGFYNSLSCSNSNSVNCDLTVRDKPVDANLTSRPPIFEDISTESDGSSSKSLKNCFSSFKSVSVAKVVEPERLPIIINCSSPDVESAQIPDHDERNVNDETKKIILKLGNVANDDVRNASTPFLNNDQEVKATPTKTNQSCITDYMTLKKIKKQSNKKMLTKGAMKVFEGLKVSIPKNDLNMDKVLSCSPTSKRLELEAIQHNKDKTSCLKKEIQQNNLATNKIFSSNTGIKKAFNKITNKFNLKSTKKKNNSKLPSKGKVNKLKETNNKVSHDIYDFEETQDSVDVFTKSSNTVPIYHSFKEKYNKPSYVEDTKYKFYGSENIAKDNCYKNGTNTFITHAIAPPPPPPPSKKINVDKSITKKKCMIMGRIFKNALKSKMSDEIKNIPVSDNTKIVEDFVMNCHNIESNATENQGHKLSEEEMDILFDNLLNEDKIKDCITNKDNNDLFEREIDSINGATAKNFDGKSKQKINKCKKRQRANSLDSSDEEFSIKKSKKHGSNRKNSTNNECVINLEQELKECIGVASRKSQRKCTSGKQNILVEYWSSDESNFGIEQTNGRVYKNPFVEDSSALFNSLLDIVEDNVEEENAAAPSPIEINALDHDECKAKKTPDWNDEPHKHANSRRNKKKIAKSEKDESDDNKSVHESRESETIALGRQKRTAVDTLYYWSSSSEDEMQDIIEIKPLRDECNDEDRPPQQGWIVGDSPKKLVTMLAQAKGKKVDLEYIKKKRKKRTSV